MTFTPTHLPVPAGLKLNLDGVHKVWLGERDEFGHVWAWQNGRIFHWSESNTQYESAWWLNDDGTLVKGRTPGQQQLIDAIHRKDPFNPEWLKKVDE